MKSRLAILIIGMGSLLTSFPAVAGVYRCVVNGETNFSDKPCVTPDERKSGRMDDKPILTVGAKNGLSGDSLPGPPRTPKDQEKVDRAIQKVAELLKDPGSANFQNMQVRGAAVCGEVNAKNSFGGYTGFSGFVVDEKGVGMQGRDGILSILYTVMAKQYGCK